MSTSADSPGVAMTEVSLDKFDLFFKCVGVICIQGTRVRGYFIIDLGYIALSIYVISIVLHAKYIQWVNNPNFRTYVSTHIIKSNRINES